MACSLNTERGFSLNSSDEANIRQVQITITAKTAKPDPNYSANDGYRTYTLTSVVTLRNALCLTFDLPCPG